VVAMTFLLKIECYQSNTFKEQSQKTIALSS